jgi:hypothetical protein
MLTLTPPTTLKLNNRRFKYIKHMIDSDSVWNTSPNTTLLANKALRWHGTTDSTAGTTVTVYVNESLHTTTTVNSDGTFEFAVPLQEMGRKITVGSVDYFTIPNTVIKVEVGSEEVTKGVHGAYWPLAAWLQADESDIIIDALHDTLGNGLLYASDNDEHTPTYTSLYNKFGKLFDINKLSTQTASQYTTIIQTAVDASRQKGLYNALILPLTAITGETPRVGKYKDFSDMRFATLGKISVLNPPSLDFTVDEWYGYAGDGVTGRLIDTTSSVSAVVGWTYVYVDGTLNSDGYLTLKTSSNTPAGIYGKDYVFLGALYCDGTKISGMIGNKFIYGRSKYISGDAHRFTIRIEFLNDYTSDEVDQMQAVLRWVKPAYALCILKFPSNTYIA